jgi:hypothetical protein
MALYNNTDKYGGLKMKLKAITIAAAILLSQTAYAGDYERSARLQAVCNSVSNMAELAYKHKDELSRSDFAEIINGHDNKSKKTAKFALDAYDVAIDASSLTSARSIAWGRCMDSFDNEDF